MNSELAGQKPKPLNYFKSIASQLILLDTKTYKSIYPYIKGDPFNAISWKCGHIKRICNNKEFSNSDKIYRITGVLIALAFEKLTSRNADIGVWEYFDIKTKARDVIEEYSYYKNLFKK